MFRGALLVLVSLSALNAQIFIENFKITNSNDVTHLRVEYSKDANLVMDSMVYSLWKDQRPLHVSQITQKFGLNSKATKTDKGILIEGSDSSLEFRIEEDTSSFALVSIARTSNKVDRLDDCVQLRSAEMSWYGGPQQKYQYWPIERLSFDDYSYVTKEADNCGITERYWLNSQGVFIYIEPEAPLFLNQVPRQTLCFTAEKKLPYHTHNNETIIFNYKIGIGPNSRQAHMTAVERFLKKPTGIPDERMVRHPIWSTWAKYERPINETIVQAFADDILRYRFNNSQYEIDDDWEICYGATEFNTAKFPNIKSLTDSLKAKGFRVTLWIHPFINKACEPYYSDALNKGYLVLDQSNNASTQWWNSNTGEAAYLDFTKAEVVAWFRKKLTTLAAAAGIDSFKFDAGESSWSPSDPKLNASYRSYPLAITTDYINAVSTFGSMVEVRSGFRNQDMPIFLRMIDKDSEWTWNNGLPTLVTTMLQLNMVGYPLVLPDMIGGNGYNDRPPNKEMFIRWLQANVFMPSLQFSFVPWDFDQETISISRNFTELHAKFTDVIMQRFKLAQTNGDPVNPPIWWIAPDDRIAQYINDEFLLGENILAAPVLVEGKVSRDIYLPSGEWVDQNNGSIYNGPIWLTSYPAPLNVLPYFIRNVKSGSAVLRHHLSLVIISLLALVYTSSRKM